MEPAPLNINANFLRVELKACQFHPDGHILAVGGTDGQIKIFETKTGSNAAVFDESGPIQALSFSENGTWLAAVVTGGSTAAIWDLRKSTQLHVLDFGGRIDCIKWDYTGQYLAGAGPGGVTVQHYDKASKSWSQPLMKAVSGTALEWGSNAKSLVLLTAEGTISILK